MNVLFISNDPSVFVDGTPTRERVRTYAKHIADEGGELHILTRARATATIDDGSLHLHSVRTGKLLSPFVLARAGKKLIELHAIDVVSAQDPFEHGIASLWAVRGSKAKLHVQAHTDFLSPWFTRSGIYRSPKVRMPLLNSVRVRIADRVLPKADGIRVVSERIRDSITSKYGQAVPQPSVIPIPVPTEVAPKVEFPPHAFKFALLSVGRLEPEKRIEDILAAVARLKDVYPSLGLFLANTGREEKKLKRMARALGIADRVVFLGHRPDVRGLMRSAQAFIQASSYEGYGMALIEAALARLPIITTDVGVVGELFRGYEHVLATPVADPANLAAHIAWLIEDPHARTELAMNAEAAAQMHLASAGDPYVRIVEDLKKLIYSK